MVRGDKGLYTFLKDSCPKVNVIVQIDFELVYYDGAVQHLRHYVMGIHDGALILRTGRQTDIW